MPEKIPSISHAPSDTAAVADIVLPLAVPGAYTYTVPEELADRITVGSRVVVPLGQRKTYTGIVVRYPGTPPATDVVLKAVADVVGDRPLLLPAQLDLWRWLADYYICTPGEVMKAALPSGLKLESETAVRAVAGAEPQPGMTPREADVLAALRDYARDADFVRGSAKKLLLEDGVCKGAVTDRGETLRAENTLIATGGISYPATGSDGSGYKLARQAGHTIVPPQPSLCSLISPDSACRRMMGLALRNVRLTLLCDGKELFTEQGEALFTHFGLSGPLVLSASTYIEDIAKHRYICEFDLKPALDEKTLYDRLTRDFAEQGAHSAQGALAKLLPNSMRPVAVEKWGVDPATRAAQITKEQKLALVQLCKHWQVPVTALGDKEHAVVTAGGVDVKEVDPKTMASKLCGGLYFAGEVLDVDARTGGYNLQIAWSTAQAAVRAL